MSDRGNEEVSARDVRSEQRLVAERGASDDVQVLPDGSAILIA